MATKQSTVEFLAEQMSGAGMITYRKMFGEYALYCDTKVVAFVCNDQLFLKPTERGKELIENLEEAPAYPGSKLYFLISEDYWDDREYLSRLISETAAVLPLPKPKKRKISEE
mgnify:CR=1 FL=1